MTWLFGLGAEADLETGEKAFSQGLHPLKTLKLSLRYYFKTSVFGVPEKKFVKTHILKTARLRKESKGWSRILSRGFLRESEVNPWPLFLKFEYWFLTSFFRRDSNFHLKGTDVLMYHINQIKLLECIPKILARNLSRGNYPKLFKIVNFKPP